jgi:energy-converting hydrogenase Eha subunit A
MLVVVSHRINVVIKIPAKTTVELPRINRDEPITSRLNFFTINPPSIAPNIAAGMTTAPIRMLLVDDDN